MRKLPALALALAVLLAPAATPADKPNPQQEGAALLARAAELVDIRSADNGPFHLRARVWLKGLERGSTVGTYELLWMSPHQWREEITFLGFRQLRIGGEGKYWQARSLNYIPLRAWQLMTTLRFERRFRVKPEESIKKVRDRTWNGAKVRCVELKYPDTASRELCFDSASGTLVKEETADGYRYEYSGYAPAGKRAYPRGIRMVDGDEVIVEFDIEELALGVVPEPSLFVPPANSEIWTTCDNPEPAKMREETQKQREIYIFTTGPVFLHAPFAVYAVIGTDGKLGNITVVQASGTIMDDVRIKMLKEREYKPKKCDGVAVREEMVLESRPPR